MPLARQHELVQRYVVAFFGTYLAGEPSCAPYLEPPAAARWNAGHDDFTLEAR